VDGIVLVVEASRTKREDLTQCLEMLSSFNLLGVVLNKVNKKDEKGSYYDYYQADSFKKPKKKFFGF
jgi:Mrp family chromosome partitioning ATPase